ncbi:MAG: HAD-IA family hydrolase [Prevotella sp.]|nr:HAD-IA family hydrolase [Prevotella sp.]MDY4667920.1 HAD-IA family hydrolase [Prevotella sp.]
MIKNIVFDFGGVLVQYDYMTFFMRVMKSEDQVKKMLTQALTQEVSDEMDKADHSFRYYIDRQEQRYPQYKDVLEYFDSHFVELITGETEGMRELMLELKALGYRLLGLSNWSEKVDDVMAKFSIFELLEGWLISKDVHQLKPHADIYESFCKKFDVKPADCLFLDDKPVNIEGAKKVGMEGIVFKDVPSLRAELERMGIMNHHCE